MTSPAECPVPGFEDRPGLWAWLNRNMTDDDALVPLDEGNDDWGHTQAVSSEDDLLKGEAW